MKSATGCGIKLREKLCSYVWLGIHLNQGVRGRLPGAKGAMISNKPINNCSRIGVGDQEHLPF